MARDGLVTLELKTPGEMLDEIMRLRALLAECADDLESWVEGNYAKTKDYPSEKRRYDRDIQPVLNARAALADQPKGEG